MSDSSQRDRADLSRFGYAQELFRGMGGFSNFAISFSIISILTGAVTLFGYGLEMGGPLEMSLGWPVATVLTLTVAASMAELCSAFPTSGAMYQWASGLGGASWGWWVACIYLCGATAGQAGIDYSCAQFILPFLRLPSTTLNLYLMFGFILLTQGLLNHYGVRLVSILNDFSVTVHILGVVALVAALFLFAPKQPIDSLFHAINSNGRSPYWWAFCLGLLQAQWTYTGFEASANMTEETHDPRRRAPWGIVLSVAVSGVVGYILILALTLAIRTIPQALHSTDATGHEIPAAIAILQNALGARAGNAMAALTSMAMWFCGLAGLASASRGLWALARDGGTPFADLIHLVTTTPDNTTPTPGLKTTSGADLLVCSRPPGRLPRSETASSTHHLLRPTPGTPYVAIWLIVAAALAAMIWTGAIPVVTAFSTVANYLAYACPIFLAWRARRRGSNWAKAAVWTLGRWGPAINLIALLWAALICVILVMPPNLLAGKTMLALLAVLGVLYAAIARRKFHGPAWTSHHVIPGEELGAKPNS